MIDENDISLRALQHYLYCPHRWGLIEVGRVWAENVFVTKGNLLHKRVHDPQKSYSSKNKKVINSIPVFNDEIGLYGFVDCIELINDSEGIAISGYDGKYAINIIEYKPTKPKDKTINLQDLMQIYAQKLCVDFNLKL